MEELGLLPASDLCRANVLILNTCSVTAEADRQARAYVRKARRSNPDIRVLVTGCYAQRAPGEVAALAGVDQVVGNSHKGMVAQVAARLAGNKPLVEPVQSNHQNETSPGPSSVFPLSRLVASAPVLVDENFAHADLAMLGPSGTSQHAGSRHLTRPNLKVQDGCGNRCSFCIIPQTRGGSRSVPLDKVLGSVRAFVDNGGQEMVLSGINLGRWGRDLQEPKHFTDMVQTLLEQTRLPRLRISSVEPMDWTDRLLELYRRYGQAEHPRLARHAHLPLQSGSDAILRAMFRRYRPWHYAARLQSIRETMPHAAIGADVMVGFPGETDALFEESYRFIEQQPFTYLHLFPFSARPGTPAWQLHRDRPVAGEAVQERMARLRLLAANKHRRFCESFTGCKLSVVTLQSARPSPAEQPSAVQHGRPIGTRAVSDNFLDVGLDEQIAPNRIMSAAIYAVTDRGLLAREHLT